jgi:hypothetical protein
VLLRLSQEINESTKTDISSTSIVYGERDCAIICLNEFTAKRLDPLDIRRQLWPNSTEERIEVKFIKIESNIQNIDIDSRFGVE